VNCWDYLGNISKDWYVGNKPTDNPEDVVKTGDSVDLSTLPRLEGQLGGPWIGMFDFSDRQAAALRASIRDTKTLQRARDLLNQGQSVTVIDANGTVVTFAPGTETIFAYDGISVTISVAPNSADMRGQLQDAIDGGLLLADLTGSQTAAVAARTRAIQEKRQLVNDLATALNGATVFGLDGDFTAQYPVGSNKCSGFVGYVLLVAGLDASAHVNGRAGLGFLTAGEWANTGNRTFNGWRVLGAGETAQPGDIFAWKLTGGEGRYTGHTGFVVSNGSGGVTYMAAHGSGVYPDANQLNQAPSPASIVYRRYVGTTGGSR
jgi:hypothetical protein